MRVMELSTLALDRLSTFPNLYILIGDMLKNRVKRIDWTENDLIIHLILNTESPKLLEKKLTLLVEAGIDITPLSAKRTGDEPDFDARFLDLLAEITAAWDLIQKGAKDLSFLRPSKDRKTPDMRLVYDSIKRYAEVKNINSRDEFEDTLFRKLHARSFLELDKFSKMIFVTANADNLIPLEGMKSWMAATLIDGIDKSIDENKRFLAMKLKDVNFEVKIERSNELRLSVQKVSSRPDDLLLGQYREYTYYGNIYYKILKKVYEAFIQLASYRKGDDALLKNDFVYLNFMIDPGKNMFYKNDFENKFWNFVKNVGLQELVMVYPNFPL